ncbi:hypothetical protein FKM82_001472 [Ascaphus truei]
MADMLELLAPHREAQGEEMADAREQQTAHPTRTLHRSKMAAAGNRKRMSPHSGRDTHAILEVAELPSTSTSRDSPHRQQKTPMRHRPAYLPKVPYR